MGYRRTAYEQKEGNFGLFVSSVFGSERVNNRNLGNRHG